MRNYTIQDIGRMFGAFLRSGTEPQQPQDLSQIIMPMLAGSMLLANDNPDSARIVASMAAPASALLTAREWYQGMTTAPGDLIYDPQQRFIYIFTGTTPMTHTNPLFFPGAAGVFHWAIVPEMHEGYRVWPDVEGIIVAVQQDEIWWNTDKTARFQWNAVSNTAAHWQPGQTGVHQWVAI